MYTYIYTPRSRSPFLSGHHLWHYDNLSLSGLSIHLIVFFTDEKFGKIQGGWSWSHPFSPGDHHACPECPREHLHPGHRRWWGYLQTSAKQPGWCLIWGPKVWTCGWWKMLTALTRSVGVYPIMAILGIFIGEISQQDQLAVSEMGGTPNSRPFNRDNDDQL